MYLAEWTQAELAERLDFDRSNIPNRTRPANHAGRDFF